MIDPAKLRRIRKGWRRWIVTLAVNALLVVQAIRDLFPFHKSKG